MAIGAVLAGLGVLAVLIALLGESGPAKPSKPPEPRQPVKPEDFIVVTRKRPTNEARGTFVLANGETIKVCLYQATVRTIPSAGGTEIEMCCHDGDLVGYDLFEAAASVSAGWRTTEDLPVVSVQASGSQAVFDVKIESPDSGVLIIKNRTTRPTINQHAQNELIIEGVQKMLLTGDVGWRQGNSVGVNACLVSGRRFFSCRS